ncbi:MAG: trypsin-like peptidase domain-containing protein [Chromatiaceae bacterium]|nr:trypsin-like peptidase domain-containing protein [Chromatiaceae bacterium]
MNALSDAVQALARRVHPCVVKVVAMGYLREEEESSDQGAVSRGQNSGSGVIIDPNGYIVTNAHVLSGADHAQVTLPATALSADREGWSPGVGKNLTAQVVGIDAETDIALLRVPETGLPFLPLTLSPPIRQGQVVLAFGSPLGLEDSVSLGIVSSSARQFGPEDMIAYIQTDAPINAGSSGGPLIDAAGRVVGINTLFLTESGASEGLGFAVPVDLAAAVVEQLRHTGRAVRAYIGLDLRTVSPSLAAAWELPSVGGIVVQDVDQEGPARDADIAPGDLIDSVDGRPIANLLHLNISLYRASADTRLELGVLRDGRRLVVPVEVRDREPPISQIATAVRKRSLLSQFGIFVTDMNKDLANELGQSRGEGGVLVVATLGETLALGETLEVGDIIYRMNRDPVTSIEQLRQLLSVMKAGEPVAFQVERDGRLRFVATDIP